MSAGWTEDRVARLKELWGSGKTAAQIAEELGDVTRNAVIGKANRLGLSKPGRPRAAKPKPAMNRTLARPIAPRQPVKEELPPEPLAPPPPPGALPQHRRCQFPIGHPGEDDFHFCDHETSTGKPYCEYHCRIAYRQRVAAA